MLYAMDLKGMFDKVRHYFITIEWRERKQFEKLSNDKTFTNENIEIRKQIFWNVCFNYFMEIRKSIHS